MLTFFRGIEDTVNSRKTGGHAAAVGAVRDGEKFDILVAVACHEAKPGGFIPPFFLQKKWRLAFLSPPAILKGFLRKKLQNLAVK